MTSLPLNLLDYVGSQLKAGASPEQIRHNLSAHHWEAGDIDAALGVMLVVAQTAPGVAQAKPPRTSGEQLAVSHIQPSRKDIALSWIFRAGFAGIFLVNGATAWLQPAGFQELLGTFPLAQAIGHIELMVVFAGINDIVLAGLILSGKHKEIIWAWAGSWLALVSFIKLASLF